MTETRKHQLDELSVADILSYLGARVSGMEEHIRREGKQLTKAKKIIRKTLPLIPSGYNDMGNSDFVFELREEIE